MARRIIAIAFLVIVALTAFRALGLSPRGLAESFARTLLGSNPVGHVLDYAIPDRP